MKINAGSKKEGQKGSEEILVRLKRKSYSSVHRGGENERKTYNRERFKLVNPTTYICHRI